ncbi:MAG: hypothetical protein ACJ74H_13845 [Thermoanaerobaculia bacterium]
MIALALLISAAAVLTAKKPISYIYRTGGDVLHIRGGFDHIGPLARKYGDEFLWFRMDGRAYLIRDEKTLGEVRQAFRKVEELEPSLREVDRRLKPYEREMEKIEEREDALSDSLDDEDLSDATRQNLEAKLREVEKTMRGIEEKMRVVEREMDKLEKESERREAIAEQRLEEIVARAVRQGVAERAD